MRSAIDTDRLLRLFKPTPADRVRNFFTNPYVVGSIFVAITSAPAYYPTVRDYLTTIATAHPWIFPVLSLSTFALAVALLLTGTHAATQARATAQRAEQRAEEAKNLAIKADAAPPRAQSAAIHLENAAVKAEADAKRAEDAADALSYLLRNR